MHYDCSSEIRLSVIFIGQFDSFVIRPSDLWKAALLVFQALLSFTVFQSIADWTLAFCFESAMFPTIPSPPIHILFPLHLLFPLSFHSIFFHLWDHLFLSSSLSLSLLIWEFSIPAGGMWHSLENHYIIIMLIALYGSTLSKCGRANYNRTKAWSKLQHSGGWRWW